MNSDKVQIIITILGIGIIALCVENEELFTNKTQMILEANTFTSGISYIELADFLRMKSQDGFSVVDVRYKDFYNKGHIPESINIVTPNDIEENIDQLQNDKGIIIYSDDILSSGYMATIFLKRFNGLNISIYKGGWQEWKSCQLPVEEVR